MWTSELALTHNKAIKTFDDISPHLVHEADHRHTNHSTIALVAQNGHKSGGSKRNKGKNMNQVPPEW